jgi:deaminated glutathione amidase
MERSQHLVAALQLNSQSDIEKNLAAVARLSEEAAQRGAELIVLPENFAFFGESDDARAAVAEAVGQGPIGGFVSALAKRLQTSIVAGGYPEMSADASRPFNTSVYVGKDGAVLGAYRKIHLFDVSLADGTSLRESANATAGDRAVLVRDGAFNVGMSICYDLRFPQLYQALGKAGANILTVPAAFTVTTGKDHWHVLLRARAIENQVFVIAAAQHGKHPRGRQTYGKSVIVDPWGDVLAQAPEGEGMALAMVDLARLGKVRRELPCLTHTRSFTLPE